jgi:hypothetical protein
LSGFVLKTGCDKTIVTKKKIKQGKRKNKARQSPEESVNKINTLRSEYDHLLASPYLTKDDPSVPTIECTIGQRIFHKTFCDIGSGVNIMSKVTYEYLFGDRHHARIMPIRKYFETHKND